MLPWWGDFKSDFISNHLARGIVKTEYDLCSSLWQLGKHSQRAGASSRSGGSICPSASLSTEHGGRALQPVSVTNFKYQLNSIFLFCLRQSMAYTRYVMLHILDTLFRIYFASI